MGNIEISRAFGWASDKAHYTLNDIHQIEKANQLSDIDANLVKAVKEICYSSKIGKELFQKCL